MTHRPDSDPQLWPSATDSDDPTLGTALAADLGLDPLVQQSRWDELDPTLVDGLVVLRTVAEPPPAGTVAVLDETDLAPATVHTWVPDDDGPVAALRLRATGGTADGVVLHVERICVRPDMLCLGLAGALLTDVVARHGAGRTLVAQVGPDLVGTLTRLGFVVTPPDRPAGPVTGLRRRPDRPWFEP